MRKDKDGAKALRSKVSKEKYKCISNFFFNIKACVKFPPKDKLCRYNGWILDVQRMDNVSMYANFISRDKYIELVLKQLSDFSGFKSNITIHERKRQK